MVLPLLWPWLVVLDFGTFREKVKVGSPLVHLGPPKMLMIFEPSSGIKNFGGHGSHRSFVRFRRPNGSWWSWIISVPIPEIDFGKQDLTIENIDRLYSIYIYIYWIMIAVAIQFLCFSLRSSQVFRPATASPGFLLTHRLNLPVNPHHLSGRVSQKIRLQDPSRGG